MLLGKRDKLIQCVYKQYYLQKKETFYLNIPIQQYENNKKDSFLHINSKFGLTQHFTSIFYDA